MKVFDFKFSWLSVFLVFCTLGITAQAQSTDPTLPTPVRSSEVSAKIAARDLGDSRLTDHYYAFTGIPGDLMITVQSTNLNGDIDVFTANGLRPLLKFSIYVENSSAATKGIFLRTGEELILRVEARTPNDDEGSYRITFGGSFSPIAGGLTPDETGESKDESAVASRPSSKKGRRVSSVGARINEPESAPAEVAATTPSPTPEATPAETAAAEKTTEVEPAKPTAPRRVGSRRTTTVRPARSRRSSTANNRKIPPANPPSVEDQRADSGSTSATTPPTGVSKSAGSRAKTGGVNTNTGGEAQDVGPRLVIETRDGTLIDRSMTSVRRVTVENGLVVIVGRDGKIQRVALGDVVRMSIAQ